MNQINPSIHFPQGFAVNDLDELLNYLPPPLRNHSRRVAVCSSIMAEHAGEVIRFFDMPVGSSFPVIVHLGATCHDIGKLLLPTISTDTADYVRHPAIGAELLERHKNDLFEDGIPLEMILDIVRYHHERPDGSGLPDGLNAKRIPFAAAICAVADSLDYRLCLLIEDEDSEADEVNGVLEDMLSQEDTVFCQSALGCLERAWPYLVEKYVSWRGRI